MSWEPVPLLEIEPSPPVEPTLTPGGYMYPRRRHVFNGEPDSGKTIVAYINALESVRAGGLVVLIDYEMGADETRRRFTELGANNDELNRILYVQPDTAPTREEIDAIIALSPALVIIDAAAGAYDTAGLDDNKRADVEKWTRIYIKPLHAAGIATLLIDHVVKNSEGRGRWSIGSERKLGGVDVALGFEAILPLSRGGRGLIRITVHRDRGGYHKRGRLGDIELVSDPDTHRITWALRPATGDEQQGAGGRWQPTRLMEKVSRFLEQQDEPVSKNRVEQAGLGKSAKHVRQAIDELVDGGHVAVQTGGRSHLLTSINPYRETSSDEVQTKSHEPVPTSSELVPTSSDEPGAPSDPTSSTSSRAYSTDEVRDEVEDRAHHTDEIERLATIARAHENGSAEGARGDNGAVLQDAARGVPA